MEQEQLHILQVTTQLSSGGVQTFLVNYARALRPYNIVFDFIVQTNKPQRFDEEMKRLGSKIYVVPAMTASVYGFAKGIYKICKEHPEYQIVHTHLNYRNFLPLCAAKAAGAAIRISHSHTAYEAENTRKKIARDIFQRSLSLFATDCWGCSEKACQWLYGDSFKNKWAVIHNAIDLQKYRFQQSRRMKMRQQLHLSDAEEMWVHTGTLSATKNQEWLIRLFRKYKEKGHKAKLFLCGDGPQRDHLKEEIQSLHLDHDVQMVGAVSNVEDYLMAADIFVFPSLFEGLSLSVVEAESTGLRCVTSSAVPQEALFSPVATQCENLEDDMWLKTIEQVKNVDITRELCTDLAEEAGYGIKKEAAKLNTMYRECSLRR